MTAEILTGIAGVILSLVFSYFPKVNTWYAAKPEETKRAMMLGMVVLVAAGTFGLACANLLNDLFGWSATCDKATAIGLIRAIGIAAIANRVAFKFSYVPQAVREAKEQAVG